MGCNCKVNKSIGLLAKQYGREVPISKGTLYSFKTKNLLKKILIILFLIFSLPISVFYLLFILPFKKQKTIDIPKLFKLQKV